jgi:hypothetical protein
MTESRGWGARDAQSVLMLRQERAGPGSFGPTVRDAIRVMADG